MKILLHIIFLIIFLFSSCRSSDLNIYPLDPRTIKGEELSLSKIADEIIYIPLDNEFPLGRISKIILTRDAIYLNPNNFGIMRYTRDGQFINAISKIGRGPDEYLSAMNYTVDNENGNVYIISNRDGLINVYSKYGQLIRRFTLKDFGTDISNILMHNSQIFIQCSVEFKNVDSEWIIFDTLGNAIKNQIRHLPKFDCNAGGSGIPSIFENKILYFNSWADTVYTISPDFTEEPIIVFEKGEYQFPRGFVPIEEIFQKKYFILSHIFQTENFYIIRYYWKKYSMVFINKHNSKIFLNHYDWDESIGGLPISGIVNDLDNGIWFLPDFYYEENGNEYLIGIQYPYQILACAASKEFKDSNPKNPEKKVEFEKLAAGLKETDNPVIIMVKLK